MIVNLSSSFVGSRSYIQGSQMLNGAAHVIRDIYRVEDIRLVDAKYSSITNREVFVGSEEGMMDSLFGSVTFSVDSVDRRFYFYGGENEVEGRVPELGITYRDLVNVSHLSGTAVFEHKKASLDGLLCSIVAANKKIHSTLGENVRDIWFTGLRRASIPVDSVELPCSGEIHFKNLVERGSSQVQTLSQVDVISNQQGIENLTFLISFAYKI